LFFTERKNFSHRENLFTPAQRKNFHTEKTFYTDTEKIFFTQRITENFLKNKKPLSSPGQFRMWAAENGEEKTFLRIFI